MIKQKLLLLFLLLFLVSSVSAISVLDAHGKTLNSAGSGNQAYGSRIVAKMNTTLLQVNNSVDCNSPWVSLVAADKTTVLYSAPYSSHVANFNVNITSGVTYYLIDNFGKNQTINLRESASGGAPTYGTAIDWTGEILDGSVSALYLGNIVSVYTSNDSAAPAPNASVSSYTLNVKDLFDNGNLQGANVTFIDMFGGTLNTTLTDASGNAAWYTVNGSSYVRYNVTKSGYYPVFNSTTGTVIYSGGTNYTNTTQGIMNVTSITRLLDLVVLGPALGTWSANTTGGKTYSGGGATYPLNIYLRNGTNNLTLQYTGAGGYFSKSFQVNITAPQATTTTVSGIYNNVYNFNATDIWNSVSISNFSIIVRNSFLGGLLYNSSTTTGRLSFALLQGYTYTFEFSAGGEYEYVNATLDANTTNQSYRFEVLPTPSIDITIRDAETGNLITENMTIIMTSSGGGSTIYTTSGGYFATDLNMTQYTIKIYNDNYTEATYVVTPTSGAVYYLTAYLQQGATEIIMQFVDKMSVTTAIENASVSQSALVNGSWVVISNRLTDVTGSTKFEYLPDREYRFIAIATGYITKSFVLNPVLFDSYIVKMTRSTTLDFEGDFQSLYMGYSPKIFYDGQENELNITFNSPTGIFTNYEYTITYPGGTTSGSGSNVLGETLSALFNITGASIIDRVNITLTYDTSLGDPHSFNYSHGIIVSPGNTTFIANQDNTYGMGLIERLLIGTLVIIIVAGLVTIAAGPLWGVGIALLLMGFWLKIGFWPWWAAGLSFLVGFALLAGRSD